MWNRKIRSFAENGDNDEASGNEDILNLDSAHTLWTSWSLFQVCFKSLCAHLNNEDNTGVGFDGDNERYDDEGKPLQMMTSCKIPSSRFS